MYNVVGYRVLSGLNYFFSLIDLFLLLYCVLSFFARGTRLFEMMSRLIDPLRRPFMPITMYMAQRGFPFDLSIIFLWIALRMVRSLFTQVVYIFMGLW